MIVHAFVSVASWPVVRVPVAAMGSDPAQMSPLRYFAICLTRPISFSEERLFLPTPPL